MSEAEPTWAIVATVDEPPAVVQAFVAWHLRLGADAIYLYFDRPDDPAADLFGHLDQVHVTRCDAVYWGATGHDRPRRHEIRQVSNARDAYARAAAKWLLHIDADEFVWCDGGVAFCLAEISDGIEAVTFPAAERVHTGPAASIFAGKFRLPFAKPADEGRAIFGPPYDLTYRGLTGHAQGKAFSRVGRGLRLSIHRPRPQDRGAKLAIHRCPADQMVLLHFEGLTRQQWIFKLLRMAQALEHDDGMPPSAHRAGQAAAVLEGPDGAGALHDLLKTADAAQLGVLAKYGLLLPLSFDPQDAITQFFPDADVDLSPDAIDRWLATHKANTLSFLKWR
ncbi:glycosyltransferase family 2 protein [Loktanella sp. Alg231-35]|uniref:glycosyltransferase family 2 protein n=1 Tax=Loktanella sp. Alg231-35 TaxID=1922220 RepID=UPI000D55EEF3|nr:glycosyltransferase family 2 protein [Loktanella sp. Alg231-35]